MRAVSVNRLDAAVEQLEWAIRLAVDHGAYGAAITLAGAAEELLGKPLPVEKRSREPLKANLIADYEKSHPQVKDGVNVSKEIGDDLNAIRNQFKHWKGPETQQLELIDGAIHNIVRALMNLRTHDANRLSEEEMRFAEWLERNGPVESES